MELYEGRLFRPPSEGKSLIIQATIGCSHNECRFCTMYKEKKFRIKSASEIIEELKSIQPHHKNYKRIFLADGDAMSIKTSELLKILAYIKEEIPNINRVGIYAHGNNLLQKSVEELRELKNNGLGIIYVGLESGSEEVLYLMDKGIGVLETIEACKTAKAAGLKISLMVISGLGGKRFMYEHAVKSAWAVNEIKPNYLSLLTLMVDKDAKISEDIVSGEFELLTPGEVLEEARLFIEETDLTKTIFRSNHASNYLSLEGVLGRDKQRLLNEIDDAKKGSSLKGELFRGL